MKNKEIRFPLNNETDLEKFEQFRVLSAIKGEFVSDYLAKIINKELNRKANKTTLKATEWVWQKDLLKRLDKKHGIKISKQTLYDYRSKGYLDGLYGSDGKLSTFVIWNLDGVADKIKEVKKRK